MTSTMRSERSRMSSKAPRLRVRTPLSAGRSPVTAATSSARSSRSVANAAPTVPWPSRPTRKSSDIAHRHVVVGLAPHDEPRVAVAREDDRRARHTVVRVRHREAVRAGRGRDDHVARARVVEVGVVDEDVARLAVLADEVAARAAARPADDLGLVARAVEHRPQVVGHAAVDGDVRHDVALDRLDAVQRHRRVRHERAPRLVEDALPRAGELLDRVDLERDVVLDARRRVVLGVGHAEAAAEVEHREVAELGERRDRRAERRELDDLRADVEVQALEDELVRRVDALDRGRRGVEVEAELRVRPAGRDRRVRVGADAGRDAHLHRLALARRDDLLEAVDVAVVVEHDVADAGVVGLLQLAARLRVAVEVDAPGVEAGLERHVQLAAAGDVAREPLARHQPQHGRARERLGREVDLEVVRPGGERLLERPHARTDVVLGDDDHRGSELAREVERAPAAELEAPVVGEAAADRVGGRELGHAAAHLAISASPRSVATACIQDCAGPADHADMPLARSLRLVLLAVLACALLPATASAATFTKRFSQNDSGDITIAANSLLTCPPGATNSSAITCEAAKSATSGSAGLADNDFDMRSLDVDGDASTFDSSSARLVLPQGATVLFAGLYWGARTDAGSGGTGQAAPNAAAKDTVKLKVPGGSYTTYTADQGWTIANDTAYQQFKNVTAAVKAAGAGVYTVADVQAGTGPDRYAGWSLVVAYEDLSAAPHNLSVFDGLTVVSSSTPTADIDVSGFTTAPSGEVNTTLGAIAYEGDMGKTGDGMKLGTNVISDGSNPATDLFNSSIGVLGTRTMTGDPAQSNNLGFDADLFRADGWLANNATTARLTVNTAATNGETILPGVLTFSSELLAAKLVPATTVTDENGGAAEPDDVIDGATDATNTGNGAAIATKLESDIPQGLEIVPGSLQVVDADGNPAGSPDAVSWNPATRAITWNVGTGASPAAGGRVGVGERV